MCWGKKEAATGEMRKEEMLEGRGERNFTPVAGNFTLLLGQVSKAQLVLVENVVPVREFSSPSLTPPPLSLSPAFPSQRPRFKDLLVRENADGTDR